MIHGVKFCLYIILVTITFLSFLYINLVADFFKMPKKAKGGKKGKNTIDEAKKREIKKVWDFIQMKREEYEAHLESLCKSTCDKVKKSYDDKLNALPENIRNMTLSEYMEMQKKINCEPLSSTAQLPASATKILSSLAKSKLKSEKKTHKKARTERKRSLSVSLCSSSSKGVPPLLLSRASRVLSESCLSTPVSKRSALPSFVVTPKFNINAPLSKGMMRKPRAGELVMSVSGSPLQNFVDDVAVSLGGGKVFKLTEDQDIARLENDLAKKLDEDTKTTLENVKKQLDKILQS